MNKKHFIAIDSALKQVLAEKLAGWLPDEIRGELEEAHREVVGYERV